ncbi:MAG: oxidoreductase [Desulfitibacter sp. BRH_c19]|nr:MAG: oxidoreductase [Desulfitibacter sp. BRH_c19]
MYDVVIVGAGPSGATLARLIGNRFRVLLIDKRQLLDEKNGTDEKCCGGLIAPDAQYMLGKLGLGVPKRVLVGPQLFTVRTMDLQSNIERYYQRHYINIDRGKFDSWLVSLIPPSVDIRCGSQFKTFERTGGNFNIKLIYDGKEYIERARILVGADGAFSTVRRQLAPLLFQKKYVAIQEWYKVQDTLPYFSAIFDSEITDFYSWTIPKEDYLLVGAAVPVKENVGYKYNLLKKKLSTCGFELKTLVKKHGCYIIRPETGAQIYLGESNVMFIGEAAGWISPTSAEGLSYSFRSALALAKSLKSKSENYLSDYIQNTKGLKFNIFTKNLKAPFMYNPLIRGLVMKTGISSMNMIDSD